MDWNFVKIHSTVKFCTIYCCRSVSFVSWPLMFCLELLVIVGFAHVIFNSCNSVGGMFGLLQNSRIPI